MNVVDGTAHFTAARAKAQAVDQFNRHSEWLEQQAKNNKCCTILETGMHPEDDTHICLRRKGHKGYHTDKTTGLTWRWTTPEEKE